ncbi:MAG: HD domain-containing protein [Parcubacteria group bacterium]|nr:HD domain-containing protein [Parcubacteria group bacterium]
MPIFDHIRDRSLAHIVRFSGHPQHFEESVADHSFFVAYIASLLCLLLEKNGKTVNREKVTSMALIHDMEERFSGDILSPFKHHSKEVNLAIRKVNRVLVHGIFSDLPKELREYYIALWNEESEQKTIEAQIVKAADRLSLLAKCNEEINAGNEYFRHIYDREYEKLKGDTKAWWLLIKDEVIE